MGKKLAAALDALREAEFQRGYQKGLAEGFQKARENFAADMEASYSQGYADARLTPVSSIVHIVPTGMTGEAYVANH